MSSGVQHCPFCGGRLRLVKVINVDTTRKSDFLVNNNASTQEMMCASCGSRVAVGQKLPTSNRVANSDVAGSPATTAARKQASLKSDIRTTLVVLFFIALLSALAYFTYRDSAAILRYWEQFVGLVEDGVASGANFFKK